MLNLFQKHYSFTQAVEALKLGNRIRRASEKKGYGKHQGSNDHFFTYWVDENKTSFYCIFTIEDIFAEDWIIE